MGTLEQGVNCLKLTIKTPERRQWRTTKFNCGYDKKVLFYFFNKNILFVSNSDDRENHNHSI